MKKRFHQTLVIFLTFLTVVLLMSPSFISSDNVMHASGISESIPVPPQDDSSSSQSSAAASTPSEPADDRETAYDLVQDQEPVLIQEPSATGPVVTITISAAGDVTLGGDESWGSYKNFMNEFTANDRDFGFTFKNVRHIFAEDDLTVVNFEGTLTDLKRPREKRFNFRAPPVFAASLVSGNIDVVSLGNNHSNDFFDAGYHETIEHLDNAGIISFGNERNSIVEVKGINIGFFGFLSWEDTREQRDNIVAAIKDLKVRGADLIIAYFHWGEEGHYRPNRIQRDLGHFTVDNGADLVLGAHPHVIQGIEVYKGVNIVYSLANFSFGGNRWPPDYDTFIFQQTFTFVNGVLQDDNVTNIIPARESSARHHNNYQPMIAEGPEADRILAEIKKYSDELN